MGAVCCTSRDRGINDKDGFASLYADVTNTPETRVHTAGDSRGHWTVASRSFHVDEVIFREAPIAMVYPTRDAPWVVAMRAELRKLSESCAWQYCVAVHCLLREELPEPCPEGLGTFTICERRKLMELCGGVEVDGCAPSELANLTAQHVLAAAEAARRELGGGSIVWPEAAAEALRKAKSQGGSQPQQRGIAANWLAERLDDIASRVSRNGFQIMDMTLRPPTAADALFHRVSFFNHCCAGMNNAVWRYDGQTRFLSVSATAPISEGEELTISYIAKPWCNMAKPARRQYLKQNFNFICLCKACSESVVKVVPPVGQADAAAGSSKEADEAAGNGRGTVAQGKLGDLLVRWMKEERDLMPEGDDGVWSTVHKATSPSTPASSTSPGAVKKEEPSGAAGTLSTEERLKRVLQRCAGEYMDVSSDQAQAALDEHDGHVGRAMITLRRRHRQG